MPDPAPRLERRDLAAAALVAATVLLATLVVNAPFIASYTPRGDDFALILNSARFYAPSASSWLTEGFARYFNAYPEATGDYTHFLRPTVNLSFWLESLVARGPQSRAFLLTNYLGHALCAGMVVLLARLLGGVSRGWAVAAGALFAGSAASMEIFHSPAFRGDLLGALFAGAGLLVVVLLPVDRGRRGALALAAALLLLAVFAKETAITAPLIAGGYLWIRERSRAALPGVALLLAPSPAYAVSKLVLQGGAGGSYATTSGLVRSLVEVATSAFFPGAGAIEAHLLVLGRVSPLSRVALALFLSACIWALVAHAIARQRDPRTLALAAATALALLVPAVLAPYPRLMYFGQLLAIPLLVRVLSRARPWAGRTLLALGLLANPVWLMVELHAAQGRLVAANGEARALGTLLRRTLRDPRVGRVYLVNDLSGGYAALAELRVAALDAGRPDVRLRVVNNMGWSAGPELEAQRRGTLAGLPVMVVRSGGQLRVTSRCTAACDFSFPGVAAQDERRLGVPGVIRYLRADAHTIVIEIPAGAGDWLVVGFDPSGGPPRAWRP